LLYLQHLERERREEEKRRGIDKATQIQDEIRQRIGWWKALVELRKLRTRGEGYDPWTNGVISLTLRLL